MLQISNDIILCPFDKTSIIYFFHFDFLFSPDLGWRDIQHMVARTSGKASIANEQGWQINGAGLEFNPKFGFGVMNADRLVKLAKKYKEKVGEQLRNEIETTAKTKRST